jgi:prepilin-type processing-associated H-X9-DG protein
MVLTLANGAMDAFARFNFISYMMNGMYSTDNNGAGKGLNGMTQSRLKRPSVMGMFLDGPGDAKRCDQATTQYRFSIGITGNYTESRIVMELVEYAHQKTANITYADGHVANLRYPIPTKTEDPYFYNQ